MGGSAFTHGSHALFTPRMPPEIYGAEKQRCKDALRCLFHCVASPIEGPDKSDFGDIDIFVAWERAPSVGSDPCADIQKTLGAKFIIRGPGCSHYAIPWPVTEGHSPDGEVARYIQVDVTVSPSLESMQWSLFKHAHGDLWSILGSIIRPYGLTVDEKCLSIRIQELERSNKKKARVPLTNEPGEVLSFLGLPYDAAWEKPFTTRDAMYQYLTQCPMFWVDAGAIAGRSDSDQINLNGSDRRRLSSRPAYRQWAETFMRECHSAGLHLDKRTSRSAVLRDALSRFQVQDEYGRRLIEYQVEQQSVRVKESIRGLFPTPDSPSQKEVQYRSVLIKALVRMVFDGDTTYGIVPDDDLPFKDGTGRFIMENVLDFISRNHEAIGAAAMDRHHRLLNEKSLASAAGAADA